MLEAKKKGTAQKSNPFFNIIQLIRSLGIDMFSEKVALVLSLSQKPFTTQFGMGCCVSTLTKTPRIIK